MSILDTIRENSLMFIDLLLNFHHFVQETLVVLSQEL